MASGNRDALSRLFAGVLRETPVIAAWRDVLAPALRQMTSESGSSVAAADAASVASELLVRELHALVAFEQLPDTGHTHILFARSLPAVEAIPLLVLEAALVQAGVTHPHRRAGARRTSGRRSRHASASRSPPHVGAPPDAAPAAGDG